jgi:hypothetical protein
MSLMLIIVKEKKKDVSIFQALNQLGFIIHKLRSVASNDILHCDTLFKLFKTWFLKFEFLAQYFWLCFQS